MSCSVSFLFAFPVTNVSGLQFSGQQMPAFEAHQNTIFIVIDLGKRIMIFLNKHDVISISFATIAPL